MTHLDCTQNILAGYKCKRKDLIWLSPANSKISTNPYHSWKWSLNCNNKFEFKFRGKSENRIVTLLYSLLPKSPNLQPLSLSSQRLLLEMDGKWAPWCWASVHHVSIVLFPESINSTVLPASYCYTFQGTKPVFALIIFVVLAGKKS